MTTFILLLIAYGFHRVADFFIDPDQVADQFNIQHPKLAIQLFHVFLLLVLAMGFNFEVEQEIAKIDQQRTAVSVVEKDEIVRVELSDGTHVDYNKLFTTNASSDMEQALKGEIRRLEMEGKAIVLQGRNDMERANFDVEIFKMKSQAGMLDCGVNDGR